jgi:hypothetical protein
MRQDLPLLEAFLREHPERRAEAEAKPFGHATTLSDLLREPTPARRTGM